MTQRYYAVDNTIYSRAWTQEYKGSKVINAAYIVCICPDGINAELVAKKLTLGDRANREEQPIKEYPSNCTEEWSV